MPFLVLVLFLESLKELHFWKTSAQYVESFTLRALDGFTEKMPRDRICHVQPSLPIFECDWVGCYYLLVRFLHFAEVLSGRFTPR